MKLTKLLPFIKRTNSNSGYSLGELLLGSSLTSLVIGVAGWGLVNICAVDQKASAQSEIQYNSNRSIEFITEEVKLGRKIESDAVAALDQAPDFTLPDGAKPILVIQVPDVPQRIIYYSKPATGVWMGPNVIERWGPSLNAEGQYDEAEVNNPETWQSHVLIDRIDNTANNPDCLPGWQASHADSSQGFNACVDPEERLVKMNIATTYTNPTWHQDLSYEVQTMAFTRSNITQGFTENKPTFRVNNKQLILDQPATVNFKVLGGDITCGAGGVTIPVTTNLSINGTKQTFSADSPLNLPNQPAETTFDVESVAGNGSICGGFSMTASSSDSNSPQVVVLVNGDPVPDITPFANQNKIEFFLQQYVENGKIKIADNEAIYLFELGTTNQNSSAFDLQDNVVLATVENPN